jgi:glycosyltransferase involved in cell wall biosynthesis
MNKVMEYMALGKAVVAYDLIETRVSGGDACLYAAGDQPGALAAAVGHLIDAPDERKHRADEGQRRIREKLAWNHQEPALLQVYESLFPGWLSGATGTAESS